MIERALMEYLANALWQIPLLAGGAWLLLAAVKAGPRVQHGVWLAVLGLAVLLPLRGMGAERVVLVRERPDAVRLKVEMREDAGLRVLRPERGMDSDLAREEGAQQVTARRREWMPLLRSRRLMISVGAARWMAGLYVGIMMFGLSRVVWAWHGAQQLVEGSREVGLAVAQRVVIEDYGRRLRINLPEVRESVEVSSPMIVGVMAPVLLLPEGFAEHGRDEMRAALLHELAHVKRRDYLVNAICKVVVLPVVWHPATHWVQGRVRRTREMVCDAMAAEEMRSEIGYARCLIKLAKSMLVEQEFNGQTAGVGLFSHNVLEERVMRLMETKTAMRMRTKVVRAASGAMAMTAAMAVAVMFHVTPTMAAESVEALQAQVSGAQVSDAQVSDAQVTDAPVTKEQVSDAQASEAQISDAQVSEGQRSKAKVSASQAVEAEPSKAEDAVAAPTVKATVHNAQSKTYVRRGTGEDRESFLVMDGERRELTQEEQRRVDAAMAEVNRNVAEAMAKLNSPEFQRQIQDAQAQALMAADVANCPKLKKQIAEAQVKVQALVNSPEFKRQIEEAQRVTAKIDMSKIQVQVREAMVQIDSPEFRRQMEEVKKMNMIQMQQKIDETVRKMNDTVNGSVTIK